MQIKTQKYIILVLPLVVLFFNPQKEPIFHLMICVSISCYSGESILVFMRCPFILQDFDSWFDTNNCLGDQKLVERLHTVRISKFNSCLIPANL